MSIVIGNKTENLAREYLIKSGMEFIQSNFRLKLGEIDLIMIDNGILVFVEVKYRKNNNFMDPFESVNLSKQKKIKKAALIFIQNNYKYQNHICRFDVITLYGNMENINFNLIKNAFY